MSTSTLGWQRVAGKKKQHRGAPPPHEEPERPQQQQQHGWIVDTCIECDHQRFSGFLKVSIEEVLIALRDDRHLLNDPEGVLSGTYDPDRFTEDEARHSSWTLYLEGFGVERFIEVIETEAVWEERAVGPTV